MKIQADKVKHFAGGMLMQLIFVPLALHSNGVANSLMLALILVCLIAFIKEALFDVIVPGHTSELNDFLATCAGGVLVFVAQVVFFGVIAA